MRKTGIFPLFAIRALFFVSLASCMLTNRGDGPSADGSGAALTPPAGVPGNTIADHAIAFESVLRGIPEQYVNTARTTFHIAYQHTSHGNQTAMGVWGLQEYKGGDEILFGVQRGSETPDPDLLDFHDCYQTDTPELGSGGSDDDYGVTDLSNGVDGDYDFATTFPPFVEATRGYLDDFVNSDINVVMWSWCDIAGHNIQNYLDGMTVLIDEYGPGGSKVGAGGTRTNPVNFIFMTGHANGEGNEEPGQPGAQAELILDYCRDNGQFCLDYYGIDAHDMAGTYHRDANDDGTEGGNHFYADWQDAHAEGTDWFYNLTAPAPDPDRHAEYGDHNNQHITANRKAYAFWWILARMAGWDGTTFE